MVESTSLPKGKHTKQKVHTERAAMLSSEFELVQRDSLDTEQHVVLEIGLSSEDCLLTEGLASQVPSTSSKKSLKYDISAEKKTQKAV